MLHSKYGPVLAANIALLSAGGLARAADDAVPTAPDSATGSPVAPGPGLSPHAPPVPPAPGGRAPSFGAPTEKDAPAFRIGGRLYGYQAVGLGRKPGNPPEGYSGRALHAPALSTGKVPFWGGAGATLNLEYGTPALKAYVTYYLRVSREEYNGYYVPQQGPGFGVAYVVFTPDPIGRLKLQFKAGSFIEIYGGPGQWGWGVFGPMLALKGYGETSSADWDLTKDTRLSLSHGVLANPGVPEDFPRGHYNSWIETGTSSWVHHAHLGLAHKQYSFKLHYASDYGTDERQYLQTFLNDPPQDGRMDTYLAEAHWQDVPWGQVGVTGGLYDFKHAASVGNGVWWAVDWTQGTREMINKYLGPNSNGNGKVAVVSAEHNFSLASMLWHPKSFNGRAPDIRVAVAGMLTRTLASDDPRYDHAMGYFFGLDTEYRMTANFGATFQTYGERRDSYQGPWSVYSLNPGIAYRSDWTSLDRIQLIYSRRFYSAAADNNEAQPLDHHMIVLGGYVTF